MLAVPSRKVIIDTIADRRVVDSSLPSFRAINPGLGRGEAKWSKTVVPRDARAIEALLRVRGGRPRQGFVVHRGGVAGTALVPGVKAVTIGELLALTGS